MTIEYLNCLLFKSRIFLCNKFKPLESLVKCAIQLMNFKINMELLYEDDVTFVVTCLMSFFC